MKSVPRRRNPPPVRDDADIRHFLAGLDVCFDGDIRAYETRGRAELLRESLAPLFASAGNHDLCAFGDENLGGAGANAARPARYDRDFSFES